MHFHLDSLDLKAAPTKICHRDFGAILTSGSMGISVNFVKTSRKTISNSYFTESDQNGRVARNGSDKKSR
ncbi:hypothetical protein Y032_0010g1021 [Ancylostoma ceylanicum]|uniref:Uncharacterized protein n=1 Tax=Ancylostoma ceylanicum TaxID=53326 RepID=A0A016VGQ8_9BILA|nr:hypothetical protein Y032_0010g1021 [Ancylostoma ceylanicum]